MATLEPTIERRQTISAPLRRVSWGAIFAGAAIATALMVLLGLLGVAIGATISDPISGDTPSAKAFGIGAGLWWIVSGILALLAGGWAAARMAGLRRKGEGPLHGLVTWAVTTTALVVLMSSAIGAIASGAFQAVSLGTRFIDRDAASHAMQELKGTSGHGRHDARRQESGEPRRFNSRRDLARREQRASSRGYRAGRAASRPGGGRRAGDGCLVDLPVPAPHRDSCDSRWPDGRAARTQHGPHRADQRSVFQRTDVTVGPGPSRAPLRPAPGPAARARVDDADRARDGEDGVALEGASAQGAQTRVANSWRRRNGTTCCPPGTWAFWRSA